MNVYMGQGETMTYGTNPGRFIGFYFDWAEKTFVVWASLSQVELYLRPSDWSLEYCSDFGLLSLGPIVFNW